MQDERRTAAQRITELEAERDKVRASHERLWVEVELFKRRLFVAKAERADNAQACDVSDRSERPRSCLRRVRYQASTNGIGGQS